MIAVAIKILLLRSLPFAPLNRRSTTASRFQERSGNAYGTIIRPTSWLCHGGAQNRTEYKRTLSRPNPQLNKRHILLLD